MGRVLARVLAWHIRTYGMWAYRHEPLSWAIYPLLATLGPIVVWRWIGVGPALWCLAFAETLVLLSVAVGLRRRRNLRSASTR